MLTRWNVAIVVQLHSSQVEALHHILCVTRQGRRRQEEKINANGKEPIVGALKAMHDLTHTNHVGWQQGASHLLYFLTLCYVQSNANIYPKMWRCQMRCGPSFQRCYLPTQPHVSFNFNEVIDRALNWVLKWVINRVLSCIMERIFRFWVGCCHMTICC